VDEPSRSEIRKGSLMKDVELAFWAELVSKATSMAISNLSQMVGQEIGVVAFRLRQIQVAEISHLMGGPETETVGIYLTVSGGADGHVMLMYDPKMAYGFVDMLMGLPPGSTQSLGEVEASALGELGNVVGSSFLNALAGATGLTLMPSPRRCCGRHSAHAGRRLSGGDGIPRP
jgi:chemotaxis protein CheC